MRIEVVVAQDCPNEQLAAGRLQQALEAAGLQAADVVTRVVTDQAEGEPWVAVRGVGEAHPGQGRVPGRGEQG
ncbi:hypothetical protein ACIO6T_21500 [Streptomyces sp. NPDC087532]|uniref:hypothetical protein n=1 Tax=unclassified Streptomyces TaxID=2593676 RepID=UPI00332F4367